MPRDITTQITEAGIKRLEEIRLALNAAQSKAELMSLYRFIPPCKPCSPAAAQAESPVQSCQHKANGRLRLDE